MFRHEHKTTCPHDFNTKSSINILMYSFKKHWDVLPPRIELKLNTTHTGTSCPQELHLKYEKFKKIRPLKDNQKSTKLYTIPLSLVLPPAPPLLPPPLKVDHSSGPAPGSTSDTRYCTFSLSFTHILAY